MKKQIKYAVFALCAALSVMMSACEFDPTKGDITLPVQTLALTAVSEEISLETTTSLSELFMTFEWTEARPVSDDYIVTCTTELDIVGNNFGSTTRILNEEDEGIFSRTFTYEQINNWANDRWKVPINTPFRLEFRVTVSYENGPGFESPEVDVKTVVVTPVKIIVFEADKVFLDGSAISGKTEITKTLENDQVYAWVGDLAAGELSIPVDLDGVTTWIVPEDGEGTLEDGTVEAVEMSETPVAWNIITPGKYRVVLNMDLKRVTIYSPATDLQPKSIEWALPNTTDVPPTIVNKIWHYGGTTGWNWRDAGWSQSLADPQIFIYNGAAMSGTVKFGVTNSNSSYVFTAGRDKTEVAVTHGVTYDMVEGSGGGGTAPTDERNTYFGLPGGTNFIVLDIRKMTMVAYAR